MAHTKAPAVNAAAALARVAASRSRPLRRTTTTTSRGTVSHATWDRIPTARPAHRLARTAARGVDAASVSACTPRAAARPVVSLNGRAAVNQYSGDVIVTKVAA